MGVCLQAATVLTNHVPWWFGANMPPRCMYVWLGAVLIPTCLGFHWSISYFDMNTRNTVLHGISCMGLLTHNQHARFSTSSSLRSWSFWIWNFRPSDRAGICEGVLRCLMAAVDLGNKWLDIVHYSRHALLFPFRIRSVQRLFASMYCFSAWFFFFFTY